MVCLGVTRGPTATREHSSHLVTGSRQWKWPVHARTGREEAMPIKDGILRWQEKRFLTKSFKNHKKEEGNQNIVLLLEMLPGWNLKIPYWQRPPSMSQTSSFLWCSLKVWTQRKQVFLLLSDCLSKSVPISTENVLLLQIIPQRKQILTCLNILVSWSVHIVSIVNSCSLFVDAGYYIHSFIKWVRSDLFVTLNVVVP